jgi:PTH1 family peptidyl-tRNA hydrolase
MRLFVGLGNPGSKYANNRHNIGFMAVDEIARRHGFAPWRRRFQGEASEGTLGGVKTLLLKPQTYMNRSGQAVGEAVGFFKLSPEAVLVIHDEVDLPPGKVRMKNGGGAAGHNGLRSISVAIGDGYRRLRIGVGHPGDGSRVPGYVLHDFAKADSAWLDPLIDAIAGHAPLLAEGKDSTFGNRLHEALRAIAVVEKGVKQENPPKQSRAPAEQPAKQDEGGPLARGLKKLFGLGS